MADPLEQFAMTFEPFESNEEPPPPPPLPKPKPKPNEGTVPKSGQTVAPTDVAGEMKRAREQAVQFGGEYTGAADVRRALTGEMPWTEAIGGLLPMVLWGPEMEGAGAAGKIIGKTSPIWDDVADIALRGYQKASGKTAPEKPESELAGRYPKVGPPVLKDSVTKKPILGNTGQPLSKEAADKLVAAGKAYWAKELTPEAKSVQKARAAAQRNIDLGNYTPYFKVSERSNVNPTRYPPYKSTTNLMPAKPETIQKYTAHANNPEGVARLQRAYEHGLELPNASNWYFMHQLEQEFIREYGEQGPAMFKQRVADALAATTGGAEPQANLLTASYGNYLMARGEQFPSAAHQVPFPIGGGKYGIMPNLKQYQKMLMEGAGVTPANPKRYNFSANILGEANAGTIDEQMMRLFDPNKAEPEYYGPYQQVLNDLAAANGVDPRYFQEVAWSGAKSLVAKGGKGPAYVPKPLIQEYNEAIERTSRVTGVPPAEVVRRGIVRGEMPIYGAAGVIGAEQLVNQQQPPPANGVSPDGAAALGAGAY